MYYILKGEEVVPAEDINEWGKWYENFANRKIRQTLIGKFEVSTVFLGLDHNFSGVGLPIVFETMVFKNNKTGLDRFGDEFCERYATYKDAVEGHERTVQLYKDKANPDNKE